jgi:hypothetical protein
MDRNRFNSDVRGRGGGLSIASGTPVNNAITAEEGAHLSSAPIVGAVLVQVDRDDRALM